MLKRVLEPELMDSEDDAREYDAMDHAAVNAQFVTDLLAAISDWSLKRSVRTESVPLRVLDLGAGTAQIAVELARRTPNVHITALDAAESMVTVARTNVASSGLTDRIHVLQADAKKLPHVPVSFPIVISNSIVHHLAEPQSVIGEAIRVCAPGGLLFHRDLARPDDEAQLEHLVNSYAGRPTPYQRKLFADSLRAALTLEETQNLVAARGFAPETVRVTSDRHWTWSSNCLQLS
jgi:ubiquinone/menaquinone biosynthesis C-methylase UbiE